MNIFKIFAFAVFAFALAGCERIETGTVGVRVDMSRQVENDELPPGSWNQVMFGDVLSFQVKDVQVQVNDIRPQAKDNSSLDDFDMSVIYNVNPSNVAELYATKNKGFHAEIDGEHFVMYNYIHQLARNAIYKSVRKHDSLKLNDVRAEIEQEISQAIQASLDEEELSGSITINQVLVRSIQPAKSIVDSANNMVQAQYQAQADVTRKNIEVETAKLEAQRIALLNANAGAVGYMQATAMVTIAEAIKAGKVTAIVVPYDFRGIVNLGSQTDPVVKPN